jgi:hypothetical protein
VRDTIAAWRRQQHLPNISSLVPSCRGAALLISPFPTSLGAWLQLPEVTSLWGPSWLWTESRPLKSSSGSAVSQHAPVFGD